MMKKITKKTAHTYVRLFGIALSVVICLFSSSNAAVYGLTAAQQQLYNVNIRYFDINESKIQCSVTSTGGGPVTSLTGTDTIMKIYNYFIARGLTPFQAAGFMGNIRQESGFQVDNQQDGHAWPSAGWGLIQWTGSRRIAIAAAMQEKGIGDLYSAAYADGKTPADKVDTLLLFQLDYTWQELQTTHTNARDALLAGKTIEEASTAILGKFEMPGNWQSEIPKRAQFGQEVYDLVMKNGGAAGAGSTVGGSASTGSKTVIALDPGHGADIPQYVDDKTKLADRETSNSDEAQDVLSVAQRMKAELETAGYEVVLLRSSDNEAVTKRARVDKAIESKAVLGVSIHTTGTDNPIDEAWSQKVGTFREYNGTRVTFNNEEVAKKSQSYAKTIADARKTAEGRNVGLDDNHDTQNGSFSRGDIPSKGNIPLVSLWADSIPWVYNEITRDNGMRLSEGLKQKYADGLIAGIKKALPATGTGTSGCSGSGAVSGDLAAKTLEYAWPEFHKAPYVTPKPEYQAAYTKAQSEGRFIGGTIYPGIDCGGFITTLMYDSGFDTTYNNVKGDTKDQYEWLQKNWQDLGSAEQIDVATLRPGDVAITRGKGHTFVYVGEIPGFGSKLASASWDERAPMADTAQDPTEARFQWFRKR